MLLGICAFLFTHTHGGLKFHFIRSVRWYITNKYYKLVSFIFKFIKWNSTEKYLFSFNIHFSKKIIYLSLILINYDKPKLLKFWFYYFVWFVSWEAKNIIILIKTWTKRIIWWVLWNYFIILRPLNETLQMFEQTILFLKKIQKAFFTRMMLGLSHAWQWQFMVLLYWGITSVSVQI